MLTRLIVALLWLLHWLPLAVLARLGVGLGAVLRTLARSRRHIVAVNLRLCFPEKTESERDALLRAHFAVLGRSLLEHGILWWASPERIRRLIRVEGLPAFNALMASGKPVIVLAPHFIGLDAAGTRLALEHNSVSIYSKQKDAVFDRWLKHGRGRFGDQLLLPRDASVRSTVRALRSGRPFFYLPDMDYGRKDSIFVPFFGVPAATITGLSRLAALAGAVVVPCVSRMLPDGEGYVIELGQAWENFPTADVEADTRRMNAWLEGIIRTMPEQYYWVHRRFKTRPEGELRPY
jgi:KDO2-lipid IV(A) lauroyltransferase